MYQHSLETYHGMEPEHGLGQWGSETLAGTLIHLESASGQTL